MKRISAIILVIVLAFAALFLISCGESETPKPSTQTTATPETQKEPETTEKIPETEYKPEQFYVTLYDRGSELNKYGPFNAGTVLDPINYIVPADDPMYTYTFLGWDANGDGVAEEFPYILNEDTTFTVLLDIKEIVYHYDIYDRGELLRSVDCSYGANIEYPTINSSYSPDGKDVNLFLGWIYNGGAFDGKMYLKITENIRIDAYYAESQIFRLYYYGAFAGASYLEAGKTLPLPGAAELGSSLIDGCEIKWYTDPEFSNELESTAMIEGNLSVYARQEPADPASVHWINDGSALADLFRRSYFTRTESLPLFLDYDYGTVDDVKNLFAESTLNIYGCNFSAKTSADVEPLDKYNVTVSVSYEQVASKKTETVIYTQLPSANIRAFTPDRAADYNDFAVDKIAATCEVDNSEALYYVIENGMRPVIVSSATELAALYESMKQVLREIISSDMTDTEKVIAIYEYLIMNVTYNGALADEVKSGADTRGNRSYHLEGVFNDHLAVCDGISKAFVCLCRMEGIECVRVTGKKVSDNTDHAWNKVRVDGDWYIVDATSGGTITGNEEALSYTSLLVSDATYSSVSTPTDGHYSQLECTKAFDVFAFIGAKAETAARAAEMVKTFIESAVPGKSTYEIALGYEITTDIETVQDILDRLELGVNVEYIGTNGVYCFIFSN